MTLNLILWIVVIIIITVHTYLLLKNALKTSYGDLWFKIIILCWLSVIFVFFSKMSSLHFLYMIPISYPLAFYFSTHAQATHAIKRGLKDPLKSDDWQSFRVRIEKTEGLIPSVIVYVIFLFVTYFVTKYFFG